MTFTEALAEHTEHQKFIGLEFLEKKTDKIKVLKKVTIVPEDFSKELSQYDILNIHDAEYAVFLSGKKCKVIFFFDFTLNKPVNAFVTLDDFKSDYKLVSKKSHE